MRFSEQLFALRRAKGLSQEELAEQVGVSRQAVSKWENDEAAPDLQKLLMLSEVLEVSLDHLCGRDTDKREGTPAKDQSSKRRSPWRIVGWIALTVLIVLCLWQLINISGTPGVKTLPAEVEISDVHFSSSDGETLKYALIPSVSSSEYTYHLLLTPETPGIETAEAWELELTEGRASGELPVSLKTSSYWTAALQISNGRDTLSVPVAAHLRYDDGTVSWINVE